MVENLLMMPKIPSHGPSFDLQKEGKRIVAEHLYSFGGDVLLEMRGSRIGVGTARSRAPVFENSFYRL